MNAGVIEIERRILAACAKGDCRASQFQKLAQVVQRLVAKGELRRSTAKGEAAPMMIHITDAGRARLERLNQQKARQRTAHA